ncbi:MAG TPA: thiamine diphosphokinase [Candidatus Sulfotelmatobacter sp.]|nr:thiamine diphosphokinase [Candidatus Sulfotelmatobacter sp.]
MSSPLRPAILVVGDGDVPARAEVDRAWPGWAAGVGWVIGADGGAARAEQLGWPPDLVVGDLDSLPPAAARRLADRRVPIERWPVRKDQSDLELALRAALRHDATARVVVLGALGGPRLDHALAAVWLLALPVARGREIVLLDATTRVRLLRGPGRLEAVGRRDDLVTLLPFGGPARGIRTEGLAYPLAAETLAVGPSRGLSNARLAQRAVVTVQQGRLLVVESHPMEDPS